MDTAIFKVDVIDIQSHALGNTDAGAEQQGHQSQVAQACAVVKGFLFLGKAVSLFYGI